MTPKLTAWIAGSAASSVAGSVIGFGVAWTATGLGADVAAIVLMLWSAPLVLFSLAGGVVGDRWGHRRALITTNLAQIGVAAIGVPVVLRLPDSPVVLAVFAAVLVAAEAASVAVFALVRPPLSPEPAAAVSVRQQVVDGLGLVTHRRQVRRLLLSLALVAGAALPLLSVLIPLVARDRSWTAHEAGLMATGWTAGSIVVGFVVSGRRPGDPPRGPLLAGPVLAAIGCVLLGVIGRAAARLP